MSLIKKVADNANQQSWSHQFRSKRFHLFLSFINQLPRPLRILDIGGTLAFWNAMGFNEEQVSITLLNLTEEPVTGDQYFSVAGNATQLDFPNQSFDIVFSNSVIEHLFTEENQIKMAAEVQRVGKYYFIQTPNYWFPLEPHWLFPFFQFLPFSLRVWLTQHFSLGHIPKCNTKEAAQHQVHEIQLLTKAQFQSLFPSATIYAEPLLFWDKSFVAHNFLLNQ
jgi:SAM-dependent methyltransferase